MRRIGAALCMLLGVVVTQGPAAAQTDIETRAAAINQAIETVLLPDLTTFLQAAQRHVADWRTFCAIPSEDGLIAVKNGFEKTALSFARIELARFGPARADNLFQRLFYWPDRKGRGLKQVQRLLAAEDPSILYADALRAKSVAVQGLPALEFVLYGTGAGDLIEPGHFRCAYGSALADTIAENADRLIARWTGPEGYATTMTRPGADNPIYRNQGEVLQELLRAAHEQLQIVDMLKLGAVLGAEIAKAKPKRAPFWRSDLTAPTIAENLHAVEALMKAAVSPLLSDRDAWQMNSLQFQLAEMLKVTDTVTASGLPWSAAVEDPALYGRLSYGRAPVRGSSALVGEEFADALGLSLGFNSLDGD